MYIYTIYRFIRICLCICVCVYTRACVRARARKSPKKAFLSAICSSRRRTHEGQERGCRPDTCDVIRCNLRCAAKSRHQSFNYTCALCASSLSQKIKPAMPCAWSLPDDSNACLAPALWLAVALGRLAISLIANGSWICRFTSSALRTSRENEERLCF